MGTGPAPAMPPPRHTTTLFAAPPPGRDGDLLRVWAALAGTKHAHELSRELAIPPGELAGVLLRLEMKKAVRRLPGNQWERR